MILCARPAFTQEEQAASEEAASYAFSTWTKFGVLLGQAEEIVYPSSPYKAELLSQLLWDIKPVFYYGLTLDFSRARPMTQWGFFANLSLKNGIPAESGKMEDRDWMSQENKALTHYSSHDNFTGELFILDFSAGVSFPLRRILLLKPYLSLSYMRFTFSGQYGYAKYARETGGANSGIYASIDDRPDRYSFADKEKIINYTQNWFIVSPGIALGYYFNNRFYAELFFQISPLIFCNDLDEHLMTYTQYRDYMRGGLFLEPGFHVSYSVNKRLELSLDFSWRYTGGTRGETYASPLFTQNYIEQGEAGAGLSMIDTGLCLKIRL
jgi:outer membrane protease